MRRWFLFLAFVLACAPKKAPAPTAPPFDPAVAAKIDAAVTAHFTAASAPGVSVAVLRGDGSMHSMVEGMGTLEEDKAVVAGDEFRIGSITKTFDASVLLQLRDEGVLTLDDTIDQWVPGFSLGAGITIRRAMNHTSGVYNFTDDPTFLNMSATAATPQFIINWALGHGPAFAPGTSYGYSNTNYFLLGLVLQAATGKQLATVLNDRLYAPLGFKNVWFEGAQVPSVTGYLYGGPALPFDMSWTWAAGGMDASAPGLCTWVHDLYGTDKVLPASTLAEMLTNTTLPSGSQTGYGLGVMLDTRGGRAVVGHTGSTMGFVGEVFFDQAKGDCVAVLLNDFFGSQTAISEPVWEALEE